MSNYDYFYFILIMSRFTQEFNIKYPKIYKKYSGWCSETNFLLPTNECLEILKISNTAELINFFITKI